MLVPALPHAAMLTLALIAAAQLPTTTTTAAWERRAGESFVPRGLARVERIGTRWALTIVCRGQHSTYLEPGSVDSAALAGRYVQARYHYVDVATPVACLRAPCPAVTERRVVLEQGEALSPAPTEAEVAAALDRCSPDPQQAR